MRKPGLPRNKWVVRLYRMGLGVVMGRLILLLTATGRKTGLPRVTPLQYERVGDDLLVASAAGPRADWICNLKKDMRVQVELGRAHFSAVAELVEDPDKICDFLELRLGRHPRMVGAILRSAGLPRNPQRAQLYEYSRGLTLVLLHPKMNA